MIYDYVYIIYYHVHLYNLIYIYTDWSTITIYEMYIWYIISYYIYYIILYIYIISYYIYIIILYKYYIILYIHIIYIYYIRYIACTVYKCNTYVWTCMLCSAPPSVTRHRLEQRELHEVLRPAARCNRRLKRSGRTDGCASGASVMGGNIKFTSIYNIQYIDVHIYPNPWEFPSIS
jgi:hypothetical protein